MKKKISEIILKLELETDSDELFDSLISLGKEIQLSEDEKEKLEPHLEKFLSYLDEEVRSATIRVLGFYWGRKKYTNIALNMFLYDPVEGVKVDALMTWANLYRNSNKKYVIDFLVSIFNNIDIPMIIRNQAYSSVFAVSSLSPDKWPNLDLDWDNFEESLKQDLINNILENTKM